MVSVGFDVSVRANFNIQGGMLQFISPPGTQFLSGVQRMLGVAAGNRISGDTISDKIHRGAYGQANSRLQGTINRAWEDGILTRSESNQIKNASRERGISRQRVSIDNYRKSYGRAVKDAYRDGKITPQERSKLSQMRGTMRRMNHTLNRMVVNDRRMDRLESVQNRFAGGQVVGFNPQKFIQNFQNKLGYGCAGMPGLSTIGQNMLQGLGQLAGGGGASGVGAPPPGPTGPGGYSPPNWQVPVRPGGTPGTQYLNWGQRLGGMAAGSRLAGNRLGDSLHVAGQRRAHTHLNQTIQNAWKDGILTRSEQNAIRNAQRGSRMADQRVRVDNYRKAYGQTMKNAYADGKLTAQERSQLGRMRDNLGSMQRTLNNMQTQDRWADRREAVQNFFTGNQVVGFNLGQFMNNLMSQVQG